MKNMIADSDECTLLSINQGCSRYLYLTFSRTKVPFANLAPIILKINYSRNNLPKDKSLS